MEVETKVPLKWNGIYLIADNYCEISTDVEITSSQKVEKGNYLIADNYPEISPDVKIRSSKKVEKGIYLIADHN